MIVYAAIDLRGGRVVQLIGGRPERERLSLPDPLTVARDFVAQGFAALHVVDLDGALQAGSNAGDIESILTAVAVPVQVGGGIRDEAAVNRWLEAGAARVIVGTRAIEDAVWLQRVSENFPQRIVVAADVRDDRIVTHGWTRDTAVAITDFIDHAGELPLAGLLITDVRREGRLEGIDAELFERLAARTSVPLIAAGGIGSIADVRRLDAAGLAGAVVGTALYTGAIDSKELLHEQAS